MFFPVFVKYILDFFRVFVIDEMMGIGWRKKKDDRPLHSVVLIRVWCTERWTDLRLQLPRLRIQCRAVKELYWLHHQFNSSSSSSSSSSVEIF